MSGPRPSGRPGLRLEAVARAVGWLRRKAVLDLGRGVAATVLVAGSARSGTTWLAGCLARALGARTLFEPFVVDDRGRPASLQRGSWDESATRRSVSRYLPETVTGDPWEAGVERVLAGAVTRLWHGQDPPGLYRRRVIKAVRGNLLLGHVTARWPEMPVVWLIRDPIEVVASQIRLREQGWDFDWSPQCVLGQPALMRDWLGPFEDVLCGAEALADRLAVRWCIENYVPSHQPSVARRALRLSYRDLCTGAESWRALSRLLVERGFARDADVDSRGDLRLLRGEGESAPRIGAAATSTLSPQDRDRVTRLVERFGLLGLAGSER